MPRKEPKRKAKPKAGRYKDVVPIEGVIDIVPPDCPDPKTRQIHDLMTLAGIRLEMADVYRMGFYRMIEMGDVTRLIYVLDNIVKTIRTEHELDALAKSYADAWTGLSIEFGPRAGLNGGGNGHALAE